MGKGDREIHGREAPNEILARASWIHDTLSAYGFILIELNNCMHNNIHLNVACPHNTSIVFIF
jgi:hypothetical protein